MNSSEDINKKVFITALKKRDNKIMKQYLQEGLDPNGLDEDGFSYLQNTARDHNEEGTFLLLQYGANPNSGKNISPLQMATGDVEDIKPCFNIAQMLVLFGATHGGYAQHQLSDEQKEKLDQIRKDYIKQSEDIVKFIQSNVDPNMKLGAYDFLNKMATPQIAEKYVRLDQKYKSMVDEDIATIQEKAFAHAGKLESLGNWIKSFFVYIEASHYKEVHLRWNHAFNIINLYTKPPIEEKVVLLSDENLIEIPQEIFEIGKNFLDAIIEKCALIGESSDEIINNQFE